MSAQVPAAAKPAATAAPAAAAGAGAGAGAAAAAEGDDKKGPSKQALKKAAKKEAADKKKAEKKAATDSKKAAEAEVNAKKKAEKAAAAAADAGAAAAAGAGADAKDTKTAAGETKATCTVADAKANIGKRVTMNGWAHEFRRQGEKLIFLALRDGTGFPAILQCVLEGKIVQVPAAKLLHREAAVTVTGTLKADKRAPGGVEMSVDSWELVGPGDGEIETRFTKDSAEEILADNRHLALRSLEAMYILKIRSLTIQCFREHFFDKHFTEVTPPTIVQTQVEGGSTLFEFNYFGEKAYLTQSSQLYLETVVPVLNKVFCCMPSFRAEKSRTRRHLSEYTHFEGEMGFITYDDLLNTLEDMVVNVAERLVAKAKDMLLHVNPNFVAPKKPFLRMNYADAVKYLNDHNIYKDEETKTHFAFGDDIPEGPERKMTDQIGKPIFLCRFPAAMKPFYMSRCKEDNTLTESVDLLMPGVGEIIGGSMRCWNAADLLKGFEHENIDPKPYYWYNDLRKFGSVPHGGWGLGIERYLCWIMGLDHIRKVCLYPRHVGRAKP